MVHNLMPENGLGWDSRWPVKGVTIEGSGSFLSYVVLKKNAQAGRWKQIPSQDR